MSIITEKAKRSQVTETQTKTWGARARDWSEYQEIQAKPLYESILNRCNIQSYTNFLDVGCGTGLLCQMAAERGARVSGLEASETTMKIANERVPNGSFILGDMANLPFEDFSFDIVTGVDTFQIHKEPYLVLDEAVRVTKRGGRLVIGVFGKPEDCGTMEYIHEVVSLANIDYNFDPFTFSGDGELEAFAREAGLTPLTNVTVDSAWIYPDEETMLFALLSPGIAVMAIQNYGMDKVKDTIRKTMAPFKTSSKGYHVPHSRRYLMTIK